MDLDERAVKIVEEAEALSKTDLRGALVRMREALAIEPDYPNLEDEIFIREDAIAKLDNVLEFIVVLLREGKDYQACEMLQGLPDNYIIQDKSGLVSGLVEKIEKAEALVSEARGLAKKEPVKALAAYEEAFRQVADYPGLAEEIAALKQGASRHGTYLGAIDQALRDKEVDKASDLLARFREAYPEDENVGRLKAALVNLSKEQRKKKDRKVNFLRITAVVVALLALAGGYFAFEMIMFKKADQKWRELDRLLTAAEYGESLTLGRELKEDLDKIHLFFLEGKQELLVKVDEILQSEAVIKGAEGKVLFEGEYIPEARLAGSQALRKNLAEGEALAGRGKCVEAIPKFEAALAVAAAGPAEAPAGVVEGIERSIGACRLRIVRGLVAEAAALKEAGSYDAALVGVEESLARAEEYAVGDGGGVVAEARSLQTEINRLRLQELISAGDEFFRTGSFAEAVTAYRKAAAFAGSSGPNDGRLSSRLPELINKSRLESILAEGDREFAADNWQAAALTYEKGIALSREFDLQGSPSVKRALGNLAQSEKMLAVAEIRQRNKSAEKSFAAGKNRKARLIYQQAMGLAGDSKWRDSPEMAAELAGLRQGLAEVDERIFVEEKRDFLLERYSAVLKKDFALAKDTTLLDPKVVLMDSSPAMLEFSLSAMAYARDSAGGQYTRYQATYVFDRKRESWRLVDKISEE